MPAVQETIERVRYIDVDQYKYGFVTDIESDKAPKGLSEDTVRFISAKKNEPEWMLAWRLEAYRRWLTMREPTWARVDYPKIDYQNAYYFSAPKKNALASLDEVDPEILRTYEKLGIPLREQEMLAGVVRPEGERRVAVDAVFDSVSVATTFKEELKKAGVLFMPMSEALQEHPELVKKYLGSVVPVTDNFFATLNSAVFSDGSFVYVPPGVRCPMELSTYFRINEANTGQFERTLIIADKGAYVSYLEGCTAPMRDENQLHAAVVELVTHDDAEIKYSTRQRQPGARRQRRAHSSSRDVSAPRRLERVANREREQHHDDHAAKQRRLQPLADAAAIPHPGNHAGQPHRHGWPADGPRASRRERGAARTGARHVAARFAATHLRHHRASTGCLHVRHARADDLPERLQRAARHQAELPELRPHHGAAGV